jgi:hypothetical protein
MKEEPMSSEKLIALLDIMIEQADVLKKDLNLQTCHITVTKDQDKYAVAYLFVLQNGKQAGIGVRIDNEETDVVAYEQAARNALVDFVKQQLAA